MQIKAEEKTKLVTYREALAALWRVRLRMGQYPIHIWQGDNTQVSERQQGRI